ncbi:MAG TPA: tripartite tricarboxylate transporter substrate binding protein [Xanthobacteraceae bacterium]|nr:tripartite tricarboxylate transporter substrate binding protein [Xanthobacteraceae bacterium]
MAGRVTVMMAALAATLTLSGGKAQAQSYPSQDIHVICAFPAGSGADVIVRYFAERLRPLAGVNIVVENKPGAAANVATEHVARSRPDGHTILIHSGNSLASNAHLIKNNPVDALKQIQVAATINQQGFMFVVHQSTPIKTMGELIEVLKTKGDKASFGNSANSGRIAGALLNEQAGLKAVQVQYRTASDTLNDLASGQLDYAVLDPAVALAQERQGRVRVLSIVVDERLPSTPDIPTMKELGYPMDLRGWFAAMVPSATPRPVVEKINVWINQILSTSEAKKFLEDVGSVPWSSKPEEGQARLAKDIGDWVDYVRIAKLIPQ